MSILFSEIYAKAIALFDDPKITIAYNTNKIQFNKLMYTFLQNAIAMFTNPSSIGARLANYSEPSGLLQTFEGDGETTTFDLDPDFVLKDNSLYIFTEGDLKVEALIDQENHTVTFPDILPAGQQYSIEQYYVGEFNDDFSEGFNAKTTSGNTLVKNEIKDILARLLVKSWAESERNLLLDIRNIMQDSDFKITGNDRVLRSKDQWVDHLDTEILQLQNKLAWNIRFMNGSQNIGRG